MVKMDAGGSITFPEADGANNHQADGLRLKAATLYEYTVTGNSHLIVIPPEAFSNQAMVGDQIPVFAPQGVCSGMIEIEDLSQPIVMVVFGDDSTTTATVGFEENESFTFELYRPSSGWYAFEVQEYDGSFPNQGQFEINGLSKILSVDIYPVGVDENQMRNIDVYPNPAKDQITITGIENIACDVEMLDIKGQKVLEIKHSEANAIDVSMLKQGVYFVRISGDEINVVRKLVVK
jgi:hypothetical protein